MLLALALPCPLIILIVYRWFKRNTEYWTNKNIPHRKPHVFFGNLKEVFFMKKPQFQIHTEIYNQFQEFPYVGFFNLTTPAILLRDPKLIYNILNKDFLSFHLNNIRVDENVDPIIGKNPSFLTGQKWKTTRARLIKSFASKRLKSLLPLMIKVSKDMTEYVEDHIISNYATLETKELSAKFTTDNVVLCGFGLEANLFRDDKAKFRKIGRMAFKQNFIQIIKIVLLTLYPSLYKYLRLKLVPHEAERSFREIVELTLIYRTENDVVRNDFLDIVNQIGGSDLNYTLEDVASHAFSFFLDGFETSSIALSFTIYELASNPLVQEKARREVDETLSKYENALTYESLKEMTYLDSIILESLRLHPPTTTLTKVCTKKYYFPAVNGNTQDLLIEEGTPVIVPIYAIHRDPLNFPNPEMFDPDRFSEENRTAIVRGSYLPFGDGRRACLGRGFALLQIKVALVALIRNFEMRVNQETTVPLEVDERQFLLSAKRGLLIDYYKRT